MNELWNSWNQKPQTLPQSKGDCIVRVDLRLTSIPMNKKLADVNTSTMMPCTEAMRFYEQHIKGKWNNNN
jgi:hypothetical protein